MVALAKSGVHFKDPWQFTPVSHSAANLGIVSNAVAETFADATAFFTQLATRGLQDTTNWTADTYKTILNVASGKGLVSAYIGCTEGTAAATHTVEFTVDGVLTEIAIPIVATGQRGCLFTAIMATTSFTTAAAHAAAAFGSLNAGKTTFATIPTTTPQVLDHGWITSHGTPCLLFERSLLIRAKHSTTITNSTATAYSGVQYRLGL